MAACSRAGGVGHVQRRDSRSPSSPDSTKGRQIPRVTRAAHLDRLWSVPKKAREPASRLPRKLLAVKAVIPKSRADHE